MSRMFGLSLCLLLTPTLLSAAVFTVGPAGAHATVQDAVDAAVTAGGQNEIQIQQGTFVGAVAIQLEALTGNLTVSGGWNEAFDVQAQDPSATILSGDMTSRVMQVWGTGAGSEVAIHNLTIRDGFHERMGAGLDVACRDCIVELDNLNIVDNRADNTATEETFAVEGAALSVDLQGASRFCTERCQITGNAARGNGAVRGIVSLAVVDASQAELRECTIDGNSLASLNAAASPGGIAAVVSGQASLTLDGNQILNTTAESPGGSSTGIGMAVVAIQTATFSVVNNEIRDNQSNNVQNQTTGVGAFITTFGDAQGTFSDNEVTGNNAIGGGGTLAMGTAIWINDNSIVTAERNVWLGNLDEARDLAGQVSLISSGTSMLVLRDSLIAAGNARGVSFDARSESTVHLANLTVADNGSIGIIEGTGTGTTSLFNSIAFNNNRDVLLREGISTGNNLIEVDPFFVDAENGDYHLLPGSPAVDAARVDPPAGLGEFDLDGEDRDWGLGVDIGAYEVAPSDQTIQYVAQVANGRAGSIVLNTEIDAANTSTDQEESFTIEFFDSNGAPWEVDVNGSAPAGENGSLSSVSVLLGPGESWTLATSGLGDVESGYARVRGGENTGVTGIFTRRHESTGTVLYQAGIPASSGNGVRQATLFVDTLGDLETGVAMVNPIDPSNFVADADLTFTLYDSEFNSLEETHKLLAPGEHEALFVTQLFPDSEEVQEMQGVLTVECADHEDCITLVTLRQNDRPGLDYPDEVPTLAAFPVLAGRAPPPAGQTPSGIDPETYYFAQIGNGQFGGIGLQTSLSFASTTSQNGSVQIEFFESSGDPLALTLEGLGSDSSFNFDLNRGESIVVQTDGLGGIKAGYARISTTGGIGGSAVFRRTDVPSGILETESGVPSARPLNSFSVFVVTTGDADTGLALANPGPAPAGEAAAIGLKLFDMSGALLAESELELGTGQHTAQFVTQLFPDVEGIDEMRGLLEVSSPVPIVAVTLLQNDDPATPFPEDVGTLTAFPVLEGTIP